MPTASFSVISMQDSNISAVYSPFIAVHCCSLLLEGSCKRLHEVPVKKPQVGVYLRVDMDEEKRKKSRGEVPYY